MTIPFRTWQAAREFAICYFNDRYDLGFADPREWLILCTGHFNIVGDKGTTR